MATLLAGVAIVPAQPLDVLVGTQHGSHFQFVEGQPFGRQTVEKGAPDFVEQGGGTRHQVGRTVGKIFEFVEGAVADVDELLDALRSLCTVGTFGDTDAPGSGQLHVVQVGESRIKSRYGEDGMLDGGSRLVEQSQRGARTAQERVGACRCQRDGVLWKGSRLLCGLREEGEMHHLRKQPADAGQEGDDADKAYEEMAFDQ